MKQKIYVVDNYDSFTYNLIHLLKDLEADVFVGKNDQIDYRKLKDCDKIVLSPGPGIPSEAGDLLEVIDRYASEKPMLGVCLGHQAIGSYFGSELRNLNRPFHGVQTRIRTSNSTTALFRGLDDVFLAGRYHSWVVDRKLPESLSMIACDEEEEVMAIQHKSLPVSGVQFHPESILTPDGMIILKNYLAQ